MSSDNKLVVILIIIHKEVVTEYEKQSLWQCFNVLSNYRIVFICPEGLNVGNYQAFTKNAEFDFINPDWHKDYNSFNRLKISKLLYKKYFKYKYILFYESDAYVFRDELDYWCNSNYDYIGAPVDISSRRNFDEFKRQKYILNGGLSLRKVNSHLKVLSTFKKLKPDSYIMEQRKSLSASDKLTTYPKYLLTKFGFNNNSHHLLNDFKRNEDIFWSYFVPNRFHWFKIPILQEAMKFSFDLNPEYYYLKNNNMLPFGCHGWWRNDDIHHENLKFWNRFISTQ